jgi:hypothetical protein
LIVVAVSISVALPALASAHVVDARTRLSIARVPAGSVKPGTRVTVFGRLRSAAGAICFRRKLIRLYAVRRGPDRLLAAHVTNAEGRYRFVRRPRSDTRVYVRFPGSFMSNYGHEHVCRSSSSRAILLDVRGR